MKDLDTNTKIALMKRIDDFVESERANQPGVPDTTLMMPELNRIAEEYALDVSDLFITYLDHIAITNQAKTITITPPTKTEYEHGE